MSRTYSQYIDTDLLGPIVTVEHNLGTFPFLSFVKTETDPTLKNTAISIYDPIFTEIEYLNSNEIKISFSGTFVGQFRALAPDEEDVGTQILEMKEDINFIFERLGTYTSTSKFAQSNNLNETQHKDLSDRIDTLTVDLQTIKNRVDNL